MLDDVETERDRRQTKTAVKAEAEVGCRKVSLLAFVENGTERDGLEEALEAFADEVVDCQSVIPPEDERGDRGRRVSADGGREVNDGE